MSETTVFAVFENPTQVSLALDMIQADENNHPIAATTTQSETSYLNVNSKPSPLKLLSLSLVVGAVLGAWFGFNTASSINNIWATSLMATISYMSVGAILGMLVGGFFDVLVDGSLDDKKDELHKGFLVSAQLRDASDVNVVNKIFSQCGAIETSNCEVVARNYIGHGQLKAS